MKKILLINTIVLYFIFSVIIIFPPFLIDLKNLLIDLKKSTTLLPFDDKRSKLPNYESISWAKRHFFELHKLGTKYYDHITWRRDDFNG